MRKQSSKDALSHLQRMIVFAEVAHAGSFRKASESLGLSASTVSHHIKLLEDFLGAKVLERTTRSLFLTEAGHALLAEADAISQAWSRGVDRARMHLDVPIGTLVVTAPDIITEQIVVPVLKQLLKTYEGLQVDLRANTRMLDMFEEEIDVAIRLGPLADSGFGAQLLWSGQRGIYGTKELIETYPVQHPKDLVHAPWIQLRVRPESIKTEHKDGLKHELIPNVRAYATSAHSYLQMIEEGLGFGSVPTLIASYTDVNTIRVLPDWSAGTVQFFALTPSPKPTGRKVVLFIERLKQQFQNVPSR